MPAGFSGMSECRHNYIRFLRRASLDTSLKSRRIRSRNVYRSHTTTTKMGRRTQHTSTISVKTGKQSAGPSRLPLLESGVKENRQVHAKTTDTSRNGHPQAEEVMGDSARAGEATANAGYHGLHEWEQFADIQYYDGLHAVSNHELMPGLR